MFFRSEAMFMHTECGSKTLGRKLLSFSVGALLLLTSTLPVPAQEPDATVKITRRSFSEGIGLTWGEGVLTYKGMGYPFEFIARGRLREIDTRIAAQELSGRVFNLRALDDFNGNYTVVEGKESTSAGATRATLKNEKSVVVSLVSTVEGRKFNLGREGMSIELKK
jgi:hypothetical protein